MQRPVRRVGVGGLLLAIACTSEPSNDARARLERGEPGTGSSPEGQLQLRLFAHRRGPIDLDLGRGQVILLIDDVPVPVIEGRPRIHDAWLRGLRSQPPWWWSQRFGGRVTAIAGDVREGTELVVAREFYQDFHNPVWGVDLLQFDDGRWLEDQQTGDPVWSFSYAAIVERGPGLLALVHWGLDFTRFEQERSKTLHGQRLGLDERPPLGFVWLGDGDVDELPRLPETGTVLAHTTAVTSGEQLGVLLEDDGCWLATWSPNQIEPTVERLPAFDSVECGSQTRLRAQDQSLLIVGHDGARPYAAMSQLEELSVVDLSTLPPSNLDSPARWVAAAARTPAGHWWVVEQEGDPAREPAQGYVDRSGVWWKSAGGAGWAQPVLPRVGVPGIPTSWWFFEDKSQTWMQFGPRPDIEVTPRILDLHWGAGALWLEVSLTSPGPTPYLDQFGVLTSAGGEERFELPARDRIAVNSSKVSLQPDQCELFTVVLLPEIDDERGLGRVLETKWRELVNASIVRQDEEWALVTHVFVARRGGQRALVAEAQATSPLLRQMLVDSVSRVFGPEVASVCRSFDMLESVGFPAREAAVPDPE